MAAQYFNSFESKDDIIRLFEIDNTDEMQYVDILLASYDVEWYNGTAFVLYRDLRDNKLYEVNGSHCSCYGLEGQWEPEVTDTASLKHRVMEGTLGKAQHSYGNSFTKEFLGVLYEIDAESNKEETK